MSAAPPATYPGATRVPSNTTLTSSGAPGSGETEQTSKGLPGEKNRDTSGAGAAEEKEVVLGVDEDQAIDGVDPVYAAKARVLNRAIMDIGMGKYQWHLFFCIGYGWAMDNMVSRVVKGRSIAFHFYHVLGNTLPSSIADTPDHLISGRS